MPELVSLKTPKAEAQESVVKVLEDVLAKAKAGEVIEVCMALVYANGEIGTRANATVNRARRIGSAAQLLHDLCAAHA